ncbi:F-box protein At5g07610-like [Rutidosis leptorrhynchoides]|uniref:F-box protein At5g07610-like n=1 Tax=Rutidosis leptorrhynchoides TaxID=125765 RepID=UPI003A99192B
MARVSKMMFETGVYWNNAIHWIDKVGFIVYFDLDRELTYEIKVPFAHLDVDYNDYLCYIFESRDQLLLVELHRPLITKFKIHQLKRDYSDWLVKYHVDFEEYGGLLFSNMDPFRYNYLLSIVLGSDDAESFLVVEIDGKIVKLNLESKTYHQLCDITSYDRIEHYPGLDQWPNVYQFAASLYNLEYDEVSISLVFVIADFNAYCLCSLINKNIGQLITIEAFAFHCYNLINACCLLV